MAFQISPGVNVSEIDLTTTVPAVSTTEAGVAGLFRWGPMNERVLISTEDELVDNFGEPDNNNASEWLCGSSFLSYGNTLWVVRANAASSNNANANSNNAVRVLNTDDYELNYSASGIAAAGEWTAKYPGALGNSLKVSVCQSSGAWSTVLSSANLAFQASSTTVYTAGANTTNDWSAAPSIDLTGTVAPGDLLVLSNGTFTLDLQVASVAAGTITLVTAPTQEELSTTDDTTYAVSQAIERRWEYYNFFDAAPGTSDYATTRSGANDELHVAVVDEDGEWTGIQGTVIERFSNVSRASDAKTEDGSTNYYKDVLNQNSSYIWWTGHAAEMVGAGGLASTTFTTQNLALSYSLGGGSDATTLTNAEKIDAYDYFENAEVTDVSILIAGEQNATVITHLINNIAEVRKDMLVCFSPEKADVVNNSLYAGKEAQDVIAFRNTLPSSSYAVMDSGWKWMYDKYNDVFRYIPLNGDIAGLMVRTDASRDPWFSPAGFNRGNVKNVIKLAFNPSKSERDQLYKSGINPVVSFSGQGTVLFGDKTLLAKPSAFDRINVRRLFIVLEKSISRAAKFTLFEFNDEFTRAQFKNLIEPFLRDVQGRRGIFDFRVVCDGTNNTPEVIDRNEFVGDIYIKPNRSINFIQLNFIAVRTGVEFTEIVGQAT